MKSHLPRLKFIFIACLLMAACSDDDEPKVPANAITLNMTAGDSETVIGGSDVYINSSLNFTSTGCGLTDLGRKGGFDRNPDLSQIAREVAVTPGNYYQVVLSENVRYVAGERAIPVKTNYYNVYVDSWLYSDSEITGAKVRYAECFPAAKSLPEWDSTIELTLKSDNAGEFETVSYSFDKNAVIDPGYNVYDFEDSNLGENLDIKIEGNYIRFTNPSWTPGGKVEVIANVRQESLYTRVRIIVNSSL